MDILHRAREKKFSKKKVLNTSKYLHTLFWEDWIECIRRQSLSVCLLDRRRRSLLIYYLLAYVMLIALLASRLFIGGPEKLFEFPRTRAAVRRPVIVRRVNKFAVTLELASI